MAVVHVPVNASMRGMVGQIVKEASGAAQQGSKVMAEGFRKGGQEAGQAAAQGLASQAAKVEKVSTQLGNARKAEAAAAADVATAETRLEQIRKSGTASEVARAENTLADAKLKQENAATRVSRAENDLKSVREGGQATAQSLASAEDRLATAKAESASAAGKVKVAELAQQEARDKAQATADRLRTAEANLDEVRGNGEATAKEIRAAEREVESARKASDKAALDASKSDGQLAKDRAAAATAADKEASASLTLAARQEDLAAAEKRAADGADEFAESARESGDSMEDATGKAKNFGIAIGAAVAGAVIAGNDVAGAINNMNNQLGMSGDAASSLGSEVGDVLRSGLAGGADEAAEAVGALTAQFPYLGFEGEKTAAELSRNFLGFTQTFGVDMAEATQTVGQLIGNGLAKDATEGIDLLTASFQRVPAAMRDEMPEIINEYGTNFRALGFSGQDAFGLLVSAADKGKWALDKTGDALKEFTIRGSDMSTASVDAYTALGLSAEDMANKIAQGGPTAREALTQTANALLGMEDPALRANTAIALFGTPLEDLSVDQIPQFLDSLTQGSDAMNGFAGSSQEVADKVSGSLTGRLNALKGVVLDLAGNAFMTLWDAGEKVASWARDNGSWLGPLAGGLGTMVGIVGALVAAVKAYIFVTTTWKLITDALTASNRSLALSLLMNPMTWIVAAIAGVIVALTLFFTKTETGKRIWQGFMDVLASVWDWIKSVFAPVFEWLGGVISTAWDGIQAAFSGFVNFLQTAWTSFIKPVFDGLMQAATLVAGVLLTVLIAPAIIAWNLLSAAFSFAWNTLIKPVFDGLAIAAQWLWGTVLMPVFEWIKLGFALVAQTLFTIWTTVIKVVWDAMAFAAQWLWNSILSPVFEWIKLGFQAVGAFFQFVWTSIIKPAWDALGAGISWVWNSIVQPVFNALKAGLGAVGDFFQMVWNSIIKPAWDALGAGISWVVDNVVRPAFDRIKSALDSVKNFFSTVVDGIRNIWDSLKGHVARPINFVIDTVWNNGLVKAWNKIGEFLPGLPSASTLSPIAFAEGGDVPFVSGSKRGKDSVNAMLMPGEHVLTTADVQAMGGQRNVYAWRNALHSNNASSKVGGESLMPHFEEGGEVGGGVRLAPLPGEGGLQPIAVLARRLIFRIWDSIKTIGGYRPYDAFPEHPSGRALDVMTPNFEVGDQVNAWTHANNEVLPIEHTIWKQRWRPPGNPDGSLMEDRGDPTQNHMDHVHTWYKPKNVDPNVIPDGLVGADGLTREDRLGVLKEKIKEIIDKALDPIKDGMAGVIGSPPPEWLGIPPKIFDKTKTAAVDGAFNFVENIAGDLKEVYDMAKKVTASVTNVVKKIIPGFAEGGEVPKGLWRDEGGMIPDGQSVVTNETGKPEAVLNWRQVERIRDILSSLKDMDQILAVMQGLGDLLGRGDFTGTFGAATGLQEDDELVNAMLTARELWIESAKEFDKIVASAGDKAVTGYRDEALDFFGLKGLFDSGMEVYSAFDPSQATSTAVDTSAATAVSTDPGRTSTGGGVSTGQDLVYGDPSLGFVNEEVKLETKMPDFDHEAPPGTGAERWRPMMIDALKNQGMDDWASSPEIVDRFIRQIHTESRGDEKAVQGIVDSNGTGEAAGVGLGQMIPGTWAAYRDPKLPDDRKNGWAMLNAMARYVRQKYGEQGYMQIGNGIGYDMGGIADGLGLMPKYTLEPERVLSPRQTVAFENWMNSGAALSGIGPELWEHLDNVVSSLPSAGAFEAVAAAAGASSVNESAPDSKDAGRREGPLVYIENQITSDPEAAVRAQMREANRVSRAASISGGW